MNSFYKLLDLEPPKQAPAMPVITLEEVRAKYVEALEADSQATSTFVFNELSKGFDKSDGNERSWILHMLGKIIESADAGRSRFMTDDDC